jgi:VWFA-related protein
MSASTRALAGGFAVCAAVVSSAQPPTYETGTQVVRIVATVTDEEKRLVSDLSAEDFDVFDEGRAQRVTLFRHDSVPITVVVMLDTSASMTLNLDNLREAAEQFVIRLMPGDRARLCVFNDKIQFRPATFTSDRDELVRHVREADYGNGTRLYDALADSLDALRDVEGRRVILVFSDGGDGDSRTSFGKIVHRAQLDAVMVYAIGYSSRWFDGDKMVQAAPDPRLPQLASETGGGYFELKRSRDLPSTFTRVEKELHSQYVLGFAPTVRDGRVHKLEVRAKRKDLRVRARRSYVAE